MIKDKKISKFLEEVSSKSPTPGGGSVAAITAATASSLVEMVCNLTIGKEKYKKSENGLKKIRKEVLELRIKLTNLADEDSRAFEKVMSAYREKDNRKIKLALKEAVRVPTKVKKLARKVKFLAEKVEEMGNKNAVSDARTAKYLSVAAIKSAEENIKINKKTLASLN